MKIHIQEAGGNGFTIPVPNFMLFSPTLLQFGLNISKQYSGTSIPDIPPEALHALSRAFKEIHKKYGTWELVHVETAGGNAVIITI